MKKVSLFYGAGWVCLILAVVFMVTSGVTENFLFFIGCAPCALGIFFFFYQADSLKKEEEKRKRRLVAFKTSNPQKPAIEVPEKEKISMN